MSRIVLGTTGSVAAIRTPDLFDRLTAAGHDVRVVVTEASLYFFDPQRFARLSTPPGETLPDRVLFRDRDEWPGERYQREDRVLHIELRKWADLLVVAPLDANTLAKFALGLSDNLLSCLYRAWDFSKPIILAPAMNTAMWDNPTTARHLRQILSDRAGSAVPERIRLEDIPSLFAALVPNMVLVPPQSKRLACGDVGLGAMAEVATIASIVQTWTQVNDVTLGNS